MTPIAFLAPSADGWRARTFVPAVPGKGGSLAETRVQSALSLAELVAVLKEGGKDPETRLALPAHLLIFERLTLPSSDPQELAGMVRLQLEKTLPYPVEETAVGFQMISRRETAIKAAASAEGEAPVEPATSATMVESTVLACVVHNEVLESFCAPLIEKGHYPQAVTPWAMHLAELTPMEGASCAFWAEEGLVVFAVFENGVLGFVEILPSVEMVLKDLPQALTSAELAGAPVTFRTVLIDPILEPQREALEESLGAPVTLLPEFPGEAPEIPVDLTLDTWRAQLARRESSRKLQGRLAVAGVVYILLLLVAGLGVGIMGRRSRALETELAAARPQVDSILAQQTRWKALAPAIDPERFAVEVLFQVFQSLPSPEVKITQFEQSPADFRVQGEAPDAAQAVALQEKLRGQPSLSAYQFEAGNPIITPNDHAQFSISGKL